MNSEIRAFEKFCNGCGLCHSYKGVNFIEKNGFIFPKLKDDDLNFCRKYCLAGKQISRKIGVDIWGRTKDVYVGWSVDNVIREKASSGGIITSICSYLLENNIVDGIVQIVRDDEIAYHTKVVVSRTKSEVLKSMGSRYSASSMLYEIKGIINSNEKLAFVGKPCDVSILKNYMEDKDDTCILYYLSFFCAGQPSDCAQERLLEKLGCSKDNIVKIDYRGNGWPGYTVAYNKDNTVSQIDYSSAWGGILGRDVRPICRYCFDGIGEFADISCGDLWYTDLAGEPVFEEKEGRNIIFARTDKGVKLLKEMFTENKIYIEKYNNLESLKKIQRYQYERRGTIFSMIKAMELFGVLTPLYDMAQIKKMRKNIPYSIRIRRFLGTVKRIISKRI